MMRCRTPLTSLVMAKTYGSEVHCWKPTAAITERDNVATVDRLAPYRTRAFQCVKLAGGHRSQAPRTQAERGNGPLRRPAARPASRPRRNPIGAACAGRGWRRARRERAVRLAGAWRRTFGRCRHREPERIPGRTSALKFERSTSLALVDP
eukprot:6195681-Pleurochrysis_carterae.AAC.2